MIIPRDNYLNRLINKKNNGLVKIITGVRRCGKSFLLFNIFKNHLLNSKISKDSIIELSFDKYSSREFRNSDYFYSWIINKISKNNQYYILLDEVQLLDNFEEILIDLMSYPNVDVYVTGSNAKLLSKDIITEFRGRGDEIRLNPLSFSEYISISNNDKQDALNDYLFYGGLPAVCLLDNEKDKSDYLSKLFSEIYINDLIERNNIRNFDNIDAVLNILSSSVGSLTNPKKISDTFMSNDKKNAPSPATIRTYIEYLKDAFLVHEAKRYDVKGRKYIGTPYKYYFCDTGLRNAKTNFRQIENNHLMENVIFNELLLRGYNVDVGVVPSRIVNDLNIRQRINYEIDFVCNNNNKKYYIQSAYQIANERKLENEKRSLINVIDGYKKIIIVNDSIRPTYTQDGILIMGFIDFLLDIESLSY